VPLIASLLDRALQLDEAYEKGACTSSQSPSIRPGRKERPRRSSASISSAPGNSRRERRSRTSSLRAGSLRSGPEQARVRGPVEGSRVVRHRSTEARKHRLENVLAQRRATWLLAHEDDVFLD